MSDDLTKDLEPGHAGVSEEGAPVDTGDVTPAADAAEATADDAAPAAEAAPADDAAPAADTVEPASTPADEATAEPASETTAATPTSEAPATGGGRTSPRPRGGRPRPGAPRPGGPRPGPPTGPRPRAPRPASPSEIPAVAVSDPAPWGRVDADGSVYVKDPWASEGERFVGSYPNAPADEALAYYGRKFDELASVVDLAEQRMAAPDADVKSITAGLQGLREKLGEAPVVGDLAGLAARLESLEGGLAQHRAAQEKARAEAKAEARARRLEFVTEAETISGTEAKRMQWKQSTERMTALFELWRTAQRDDIKLDKSVEDELWHRFSHARTVFDRARKHHFAQLHAEHGQAKAAKEKLIAEAEKLSASTDWAGTSTAYRQLLDQWKKAGRAGRKDDDALWARFRAAQDVFYAARSADNAKSDAEMADNLAVKEKLVAEAEALLPIKDMRAAKNALRSIEERWDAAGKVPRGDLHRIERRLKAVEQAVREREEERWRRSNPETKARAEGALGQLEAAIAGLEEDLARARKAGNARTIADAEAALSARRAWLDQIQRTAREFR